MKKTVIALLLLSSYALLFAQSGTLDQSFGGTGFIKTPATAIGYSVSVGRQVFVNADGTLSFVLQVQDKAAIARRLADGTLDATYRNNGYSDMSSIYLGSSAIQSDGKIVLAGIPNQSSGFMLVRYNTDGSLDASFGQGGVTITPLAPSVYLNAITITQTGDIIVGGGSAPGGHTEFTLARYSSSGMLDPTFGNNGLVTTDINAVSSNIVSLALQPNGMIIAGGTVQTNGNGDFAMARYDVNGNLDRNFNSTGIVTSDFGSFDYLLSVAVDADGRVYAGGTSFDGVAYNHFRIARYNSDGTTDLSFNGGSVFPTVNNSNEGLVQMKIQSDGKIVAEGTISNGSQDIEIIRFNTDGTLDNGFGNNGFIFGDINSAQDDANFLDFDSDGKILAGGDNVDFSKIAGYISFSCFRFNTDGSPDNGFGSGGSVIDFLPIYSFDYRSMFEQKDGKLLTISGSNAQVDNSIYLNRFNSDGSLDNSLGQGGRIFLNPSAAGFFQPDGKVLAVSYSGSGDINLTRYNTDGNIDPNFGVSGNVTTDFGGTEYPNLAAFQTDNKIIVGGATYDDNGSDCIVVRYNSDGSLDQSFGNGAGFAKIAIDNYDQPQDMVVGPDGKIVVAILGEAFPPDFSYFYFDILIVRLNSDGTPDQSFGNQGTLLYRRSSGDFVGPLQVLNNNKIVFTDLLQVANEGYTSSLQRLNVDGTLDLTFGQNGIVSCDPGSMIVQSDGKMIVAGYQPDNQGNLKFTLSRFNDNGEVDPTFGNNGQTILSFTDLDNRIGFAYLSSSSNSLFVSGAGTSKNEESFGIIAKFHADAAGSISCPGDTVVNTDKDLCSAQVNNIDPTVTPQNANVTYKLTGATTGSGNGSAGGKIFNKGITTVTYTLSNDATKSCTFTVTVLDKQKPVIDNLSASPSTLWPPDHSMKDILVNYSASDNCGVNGVQLIVSSNEPIQTAEKDDQSPDWQILDSHHVRLRAERLESGNGRTYTIKVTASDSSGNRTTASTTVTVAKSNIQTCHFTVTAAPNPSNNYFLVTLKSSCSDKISLRLTNNMGTLVTTMSNLTSQQTVKLGTDLLPGIYFLDATQGANTQTLKLVKQ
jgi:uncharacterized delta-60 repeat protein